MALEHVGVVGAGIVGLAVAREIQRKTGARVTVMDKEPEVGAHQTGHNSNVVHSGVYYAPGSLKAALCRSGLELLKNYCHHNDLAYREIGKIIVAVREEELPRLRSLAQQAESNGIPGARLIGPKELTLREPHVVGRDALLIPGTAIVDYKQIAEQLAADVVQDGGTLALGTKVDGVDADHHAAVLRTASQELTFDHVVVCAGLHSSILAVRSNAPEDPAILPFRGEYFEIVPSRAHLVKGLIYPVPDPRYPFLGVHFTPGVDGRIHVGPNAVLALAQEGYRWRDVNPREVVRSIRYPGTRKLAQQHWRAGTSEVLGSVSKSLFLHRARAYIPDLNRADLIRTEAGVRAQAVGVDGGLVDDFVIQQRHRITFVRNAPSPAATASLAIAAHIVADTPAFTD